MASNDRVPPPHLRLPLPGRSMVHPDPYGPPIHPPPGGFPLEMLPPEVMEQKLTAQHVEMDKLATENQRLATTHRTLRQDLATAKHELQSVHAYIADMKADKEQHTRRLMDKIARMEAELQAAESIKTELQQAHAEAKSLFGARQELISQAQQLTRDLQMAHSEAQQIPALMSELENLRQEYQHCRATYDYEKKLYSDHLESLQVMEKNYMAMSREVDKLRAELTNSTNFDPRTGGPYGGSAGYSGGIPMGNYATYDGYGLPQQGQTPVLGGGTGAGAAGTGSGARDSGTGVTSPHVVAQSAPGGLGAAYDASKRPGYDALRGPTGPGYDVQRGPTGPAYDAQRGPTGPGYDGERVPTGPSYNAQRGPTGLSYDPQRGPKQDTQKGPGYDADKAPGYDGQRPPPTYDFRRDSGNDIQRGSNYDPQKAAGYDPLSRGAVGPQGQVPNENVHHTSAPPPPTRPSGGYEAPGRGGNPIHR
ncbi:protein FLX-like 2 isoform X1 [Olea europaea var. sylvestris]|uniref:protein FLX-like 2 isoform X1 n=1 Tax=Olea europaea var. sylvestris TaxID=158386 RepID=UPI000C1D253A|nr:protein FLX-like 2 isoform X1 [Olea europaea var. sylvestris]XP_022853047.1 protein FLX-like 2 isoform X1 [Olea europaea var. sylvestris]